MFCKIKLRTCGKGFKDFDVVPGDGVSSGQGMMGGGGFDPVCGFVLSVVSSNDNLVLLIVYFKF